MLALERPGGRRHGSLSSPLTIVVGSGGVGKTTLAAALGLRSAASAATIPW